MILYTFYYIWLSLFVFGPGAARAAPGASVSLGIGRRTLRGVPGARLTHLRHNQAALRAVRGLETYPDCPICRNEAAFVMNTMS